MTEKQMISTLKGLTFGTVVGSKGVEALDMAIQALSQEPCTDAVSRRKAIHVISACDGKSAQIEALEQLPSVTPSRRKGHWIREVDFGNCVHYVCSECKNEGEKDYCPNCGAEMFEP